VVQKGIRGDPPVDARQGAHQKKEKYFQQAATFFLHPKKRINFAALFAYLDV
jgi:hypothetical protein